MRNCKECSKPITPENDSKQGNWCKECKNAYIRRYKKAKGTISQYKPKIYEMIGDIKVRRELQSDRFILNCY